MDKPHLVLDWVFDIPNQKLFCKLDDNVKYIAIDGGKTGVTKRVTDSQGNVTETFISEAEWNSKEKYWISNNYGEKYGYYQPDWSRVIEHPIQKRPDLCPMGVGPDGRYIDHLQRMQVLLDGEDCAKIAKSESGVLFVTPDKGKTIFKRPPTNTHRYFEHDPNIDRNVKYVEHPQPCMMQPRGTGVQASSYEEMQQEGIEVNVINKCKNGEWNAPLHPELQKNYIYPIKVAPW